MSAPRRRPARPVEPAVPPRRLLMLPATVPCVLKGQLPGNEISVMRCVQQNNKDPDACNLLGCQQHLGAAMALKLTDSDALSRARAEVV